MRFTDIYHYSNDFFISIGFYPYQFPFFGGLMWGGISVCALRIANKFSISNVMKALLSGWLIVSMDLLLDVVAIRLNGGFWVWDGRPITLDINHHMFMSVIWVNFLGYMFEVPAIIFMTLKQWDKSSDKSDFSIAKSLLIGICGVLFVAIASAISLVLDKITDEWFSCIAFLLIWIFVFIKLISILISHHKSITFKNKKDWSLFIFWFSIYVYCIAALFNLNIMSANFLYAFFTFFIMIMTLVLSLIDIENNH